MPKRYEELNYAHYLTFSCYKRYRLFTNEDLCNLFVNHLDRARDRRKFDLWAFVIMPTHVHLLIRPSVDDSISKILISLKKSFSYEALPRIKDNNPEHFARLSISERGHKVRRFWQVGGGYDSNIFTANIFKRKIDYMHMNPVKKGLVNEPVEWQWSSARFWIQNICDPLSLDDIEIF